jgi:hypothetical protein
MKNRSPRSSVLAVLLLLLSTAGANATLAQKAGGGAKLMVTVTVPPICTVAVTPGQLSAAEAIAVRCRNLPDSHPQPVVTEAQPGPDATMVADDGSEVAETPESTADQSDVDPVAPPAMVVINF